MKFFISEHQKSGFSLKLSKKSVISKLHFTLSVTEVFVFIQQCNWISGAICIRSECFGNFSLATFPNFLHIKAKRFWITSVRNFCWSVRASAFWYGKMNAVTLSQPCSFREMIRSSALAYLISVYFACLELNDSNFIRQCSSLIC